MGRTSIGTDWQPVYLAACELPEEERSAVFADYRSDFTNDHKYNHELLQEALDRHLAKPQPDAGQEYEEALLAVEIFEEVEGGLEAQVDDRV